MVAMLCQINVATSQSFPNFKDIIFGSRYIYTKFKYPLDPDKPYYNSKVFQRNYGKNANALVASVINDTNNKISGWS